MKIKTFFLITCSAVTLALAVSCQPEKNTGSLTFETIKKQEKGFLFNDEKNPSCTLSLEFTYVENSSSNQLKDSMNNYFIALFFGDNYQNRPIEEIFTDYTTDYIQTYKNDLESIYKEDEEIPKGENGNVGSWYFYEKSLSSLIDYYNKDLLVYRINYNEYTGGAHGIYAINYYNFDLQKKMIITLNDILVPNYQEALTTELWNQLMIDNQVSSKEQLRDMGFESTGDLIPTSNFALNDTGITFTYNVYEIAPYSMGAISITLPYEKISHLFNSNPILQSALNL
ncbi:MAG: DUF3298 and DUF4163 domain-containing protein [Bacteroidales bacterium]|nr:DUF3298 and DUF4163 domain-containing protein [Bacteroidales bacterium]